MILGTEQYEHTYLMWQPPDKCSYLQSPTVSIRESHAVVQWHTRPGYTWLFIYKIWKFEVCTRPCHIFDIESIISELLKMSLHWTTKRMKIEIVSQIIIRINSCAADELILQM